MVAPVPTEPHAADADPLIEEMQWYDQQVWNVEELNIDDHHADGITSEYAAADPPFLATEPPAHLARTSFFFQGPDTTSTLFVRHTSRPLRPGSSS